MNSKETLETVFSRGTPDQCTDAIFELIEYGAYGGQYFYDSLRLHVLYILDALCELRGATGFVINLSEIANRLNSKSIVETFLLGRVTGLVDGNPVRCQIPARKNQEFGKYLSLHGYEPRMVSPKEAMTKAMAFSFDASLNLLRQHFPDEIAS